MIRDLFPIIESDNFVVTSLNEVQARQRGVVKSGARICPMLTIKDIEHKKY